MDLVTMSISPETKADDIFGRAMYSCKMHSPIPIYLSPLVAEGEFKIAPSPVFTDFAKLLQPLQDSMLKFSMEIKAFAPAFSVTQIDGHPVLRELTQVCPALATDEFKCPECMYLAVLGGIIPHLNDVHVWSRDAIADWLESLDVDLTIQKKGI